MLVPSFLSCTCHPLWALIPGYLLYIFSCEIFWHSFLFVLHRDWRSKFNSFSENWHFGSSCSGSVCKASEKHLHPIKSYNLHMDWIITASCISSPPTQAPVFSSLLSDLHGSRSLKKLLEYSMKSWKLQKKNNPKMWGVYIIVLGQSSDFLIVLTHNLWILTDGNTITLCQGDTEMLEPLCPILMA